MTRARVAAALMVVTLAAACSSDRPRTTSSGSASLSAASGSTAPPPAGLPAFYGVPDPLPKGNPGDVIKSEVVAVTGVHGTVERVMYHSRSLHDEDVHVTGLIAVPSTPPPSGGYPVISWAHGTTGIADTCAPSITPDDYGDIANQLLDAGYVVVGTDYEGLGTPGRHPYIVGESEARSTLDIVRAARNLPDVHASERFAVW